MPEYRMQIPPDKVADVRKWLKERGGCVVWKNQEIGNNLRPDLMTPATHEDGTPATPPHWAMGDGPHPIKPEEIGVCARTPVELPPEWFPTCSFCEGTGRYPVKKIADARKISYNDALDWCRTDDRRTKTLIEGPPTSATVECTGCSGKGHTIRPVLTRGYNRYWGFEVPESQKVKATVAKLEKVVKDKVYWNWTGWDGGLVRVNFYTEKLEPFTLED